MLPESNQIIEESLVDDLAKQLYNTSKILYCLKEEEREKIIHQLVKDFLKPYIKINQYVNVEKSSGDQECLPK